MDPATLAAGAIALLTSFLVKAGAEFAEEGGKAAWGLASRLFDRLRSAVTDKPREQDTFEEFSQEPERTQTAARTMLRDMLESDPALAAEVAQILESVKRLGPEVRVVQRIVKAEEVLGAEVGTARAGSLEVDQEVDEATTVTGVKITGMG